MSDETLTSASDFKGGNIELKELEVKTLSATNTDVNTLTFNAVTSGYHITGTTENSLISILSSVTPVIKSVYFVDRDYGGNLVTAITDLPSGCVLILGYGPYVIPNATPAFEKSNYAIRGTRMPVLNTAGNALTAGSIIIGTLILSGDNIELSDFGVDRGTVANAANFSGATGDALVVHDATLSAVRYNINVKNV